MKQECRVSAPALSRRRTHCLPFFFQAGSELSLSKTHYRIYITHPEVAEKSGHPVIYKVHPELKYRKQNRTYNRILVWLI